MWHLRVTPLDDIEPSGDQSVQLLMSSPEMFYRHVRDGSPSLAHDIKQAHGKLGPRFGMADWSLSLGVGQHVPRELEDVFVANLVRHAEVGIVLSWGSSGEAVNPRTPLEVEHLLCKCGFLSDAAAAKELRFFAGLGYGGPRNDLLVFRKRGLMDRALSNREHNIADSLHLAAAWTPHQCTFGMTYGLLRPSHMWVSSGCGGLFENIVSDSNQQIFCLSASGDYKECSLGKGDLDVERSLHAQKLADDEHTPLRIEKAPRQARAFSPTSRSLQNSHAASDHLVPQGVAWRGHLYLNMVFYKFAQRLGDGAGILGRTRLRTGELTLEWAWLWRTEWRGIIEGEGPIQARRSRTAFPQQIIQRLTQLLTVFLRLARRFGPMLVTTAKRAVRWRRVHRLFRRTLVHLGHSVAHKACDATSLDCSTARPPGVVQLWRNVQLQNSSRQLPLPRHYESRHLLKSCCQWLSGSQKCWAANAEVLPWRKRP